MMNNLLRRLCKDTIVYWANPVSDGRGGYIYSSPVEIKGKWFDETEIIKDTKGEEPGEKIISNSYVFLLQDVEENAYLYKGMLDDLNSVEQASPEIIDGSHRVLKFSKITGITGKSTVRKAYLK